MVRSEARATVPGGGPISWNPLKSGNIAKGMGTGLAAYFAVNQLVIVLTRRTTWMNKEPAHELNAFVSTKSTVRPYTYLAEFGVFRKPARHSQKCESRHRFKDVPGNS